MSDKEAKVVTVDILYKWLQADNSAPLGLGKWQKNRWRSVKGQLVACENGLHLARPKELARHISDRLWIAEADLSEVVECDDKIVVRRARVIKQVETINDYTLRAFAADCADRVVHFTGPDPRCVAAIAAARRFARQEITREELAAAYAPAYATYAAAYAAAAAAAYAAANANAVKAAAAAVYAAAAPAAAAANARLLQYVHHGLDAMDMPWPVSPAWPDSKEEVAA